MRTSGTGMARALIVVAEETPAAFPAGNSDLESSGCLAAIGGEISRCKIVDESHGARTAVQEIVHDSPARKQYRG
jgi:hypothetical protein